MRISTTQLNLVDECPRCLWLAVRKNKYRPSMFSTVPGALHKIIEREANFRYLDRGEKPPWMAYIQGRKVKTPKMEYTENNLTLVGVLDGLLKREDGAYTILEYKTSRAPYDRAKAEKYYGYQLDAYAFLSEKNGFKPVKGAYLIFFCPSLGEGCEHRADSLIALFQVHSLYMSVNSARIPSVLDRIRNIASQEVPPPPSMSCPYCNWCNY